MPKRAFAEEINDYQLLLAGLKKNQKELSLAVRIPDFDKMVGDAVEENKVQEELKAKTQQSTQRLNKIVAGLKEQSARIYSGLYAQYGKKSEKLEEFGIKPWKTGARKRKAGAAGK